MKKTLLKTTLLAAVCLMTTTEGMAENKHVLWYDRPAYTWTEALPIGNSRLGAMIYGTPGSERLQLNEETIWAGRPNNNANPEAKEYLPKVRQLVWEGKYKEAQDLATAHVQANTNSGMPYQPFGDLYINFPGNGEYTNISERIHFVVRRKRNSHTPHCKQEGHDNLQRADDIAAAGRNH